MTSVFSAKPLLAVALALGGLAAASGAHAGSLHDAIVSVNVQVPARHVQPAPVVVQPAPVYAQPAPVYAQPAPVRVQPRYVQGPDRRYADARGPWGDRDHDGVPNRYDRHDDRRANDRGPWGDADHDGVPNRYDRAPNNPYRR